MYIVKTLRIRNRGRLSGAGRDSPEGHKYRIFRFYAFKIQYQMNFFGRRWVGTTVFKPLF
jgi:hypothetical protein